MEMLADTKRHAADWKNIFAREISDLELLFKHKMNS